MSLLGRSSFWQHVKPVGAIADFITVFRQAGHNRWRIAALSGACTFAVFATIWQEEGRGPPARPTITYITSFAPGRTDAEIMASNIANQKRKEKLAAEQLARDEKVRDIYKTIGRASGMDVDAIERKAKAEREAEERAERRKFGLAPAQQPKSEAVSNSE